MSRFCLSLIALMFLCTSTFAQAPKKYALLVAVTTYEHAHLNQPPKIQYPEADATAIGDQLKLSGYEVELLLGEQATKTSVELALQNLARKGNQPGVIVIGFFGHGVEYDEKTAEGQLTSRSYFCPYDATMRNRVDANGKPSFISANKPRIEPDPSSLISMGQVFSAMALSPAGNRVLLADCCRNDPHAARKVGRGFGTGIKSGDLPENANTAALFACSKGEEALEDSESKHGVFTKCVLDWIAEPMGKATAGRLGEHLDEAVPQLVSELTMGELAQQPKFLNAGRVDLQLAAISPGPAKPKPVMPKPSPASKSSGFTGGTNAGEVQEITLPGDVKMKLVWCPPGTFTMGSPASEKYRDKDENQVEVTLTKGYWLGQTEVTQAQWTAVMGPTSKPWSGKDSVKEGVSYPASYVSHGMTWDGKVEADSATAFCEKLTELERKAGRLPTGWKYALPTEAEWEYACRAGTKTAYSFGDDESQLSEYAWCDIGKSQQYGHAVGTKKANVWGLYDMHGNLNEWCRDGYANELLGGSDPLNTSAVNRVFRGGSWITNARNSRSAFRSRYSFEDRDSYTGFRVSRTQ